MKITGKGKLYANKTRIQILGIKIKLSKISNIRDQIPDLKDERSNTKGQWWAIRLIQSNEGGEYKEIKNEETRGQRW